MQATGGPSSSTLSTQTYSYDRYGNRTSVSASGYSASLRERGNSPTVRDGSVVAKRGSAGSEPGAVATGSIPQPDDPKVTLPTDLLAKSSGVEPARGTSRTVREGSEAISDSSTSLYKPSTTKTTTNAPTDPPTFTNSPLTAGVEVKALHITELRDAINALRARLGMSAYSWTTLATTNDWISANPILEMRTALDQTLGAPSPGYATGLAQGQPIMALHIQELRDRVVAGWTASSQIPRDGHASLSYDTASNRITTSGFAYDAAGNQVRALISSGASQRFQYDAANRLMKVKADDNTTVLATYTYGDSNERLMAEEGGLRTYYACNGNAEYIESGGSTTPAWSKSYVYLGARLLSTLTPNGSGGEAVEYHHPDRLGTRLVTNPSNGASFEQVTLPFGTALNAESTGATNRRFTSYDRSTTTGLDYASNRHYDSQQGRFTQIDPIGMGASNQADPQSLNMYAYCGNDPVNQVDPSGLFWGRLWRFIKKAVVILMAVLATVVAILAPTPQSISQAFQAWIDVFGGWDKIFPKASKWLKLVPSHGNVSVGIGSTARGTPPWNPDSPAFFQFQGQGGNCPPDCSGSGGITLSAEVVTIYANYTKFEMKLWRLQRGIGSVNDYLYGIGDSINPVAGWIRQWGGRLSERMTGYNTDPIDATSDAYSGGECTYTVATIIAPGPKVGVARSAATRAGFLRGLAESGKTPRWMNQFLRAGRVPPGYNVEHILPLSVGGLDVATNMRLNMVANHRLIHRWYHPWRK